MERLDLFCESHDYGRLLLCLALLIVERFLQVLLVLALPLFFFGLPFVGLLLALRGLHLDL